MSAHEPGDWLPEDAPNMCDPGSYCGGCGRIVRPGLRGACCIAVDAARLQSQRDALLAACEAAAGWLHDPSDANGHFERLAEEFRRDTGFMRPGKDAAAAAHQDPLECDIAWNEWRVVRAAKVLADLRAAIAAARGGGE